MRWMVGGVMRIVGRITRGRSRGCWSIKVLCKRRGVIHGL